MLVINNSLQVYLANGLINKGARKVAMKVIDTKANPLFGSKKNIATTKKAGEYMLEIQRRFMLRVLKEDGKILEHFA